VCAEVDGLRAALDLYDRAVEEPIDGRLRARVMLHRCDSLWSMFRYDDAIAVAEEAIVLGRDLHDQGVLAQALAILGDARVNRGEAAGEALVAEAVELERAGAEMPLGWSPREVASRVALTLGGDVDQAYSLLRELVDEARLELSPALVPLLYSLCETEFRRGDAEASEALATEGLALAEQTGREAQRAAFLAALGAIAAVRGDLEKARAHAERAYELGLATGKPMGDHAIASVARLELLLGNVREAADSLEGVLEERVRRGDVVVTAIVSALAEARVAMGDVDGAKRLLDEHPPVLQFAGWESFRARSAGIVAAAAKDRATAVSELARAVDVSRLPDAAVFTRALALLAYGSFLRRDRRKAPARKALEEAAWLFERLDATPWLDETKRELASLGGRQQRPSGLTATEQRIAELVARGRPNADVARELFVSPKTVEWNLSKIYKKLGVRGRAELAAKLARRA
jgi:DNA-binding CsgD family transcriptional regulator